MLALASDFDGTLFFSHENPPFHPEDLEAIRAFRSRGNLFILCTGRPINFFEYLVQGQIIFDFYVCSTGAYIADKNRQVLRETCISYETACELLALGAPYEVSLHLDQNFYWYQTPVDDRPVISTAAELSERHIHTITFMTASAEEAEALARLVNRKFPGQVTAFQNNSLIDIVPAGCSKGAGLDFCRATLAPDRIAAIGDSQNDVPMFRCSDESFTFVSSPDAVKRQATHVVSGLYEAIALLSQKP